MKRALQGAFWIGIYLFLIGAPLFLLLVGATPVARKRCATPTPPICWRPA